MRLFEATGVGTCLLSDTRENMPDLFEVDKEVVTYSTIDEAVEKVNYLLENEDVRKEIASAGQRRTLKDHTIFNRYQQIDEVIRSNLWFSYDLQGKYLTQMKVLVSGGASFIGSHFD